MAYHTANRARQKPHRRGAQSDQRLYVRRRVSCIIQKNGDTHLQPRTAPITSSSTTAPTRYCRSKLQNGRRINCAYIVPSTLNFGSQASVAHDHGRTFSSGSTIASSPTSAYIAPDAPRLPTATCAGFTAPAEDAKSRLRARG